MYQFKTMKNGEVREFKEAVKKWITKRVANNSLHNCRFWITVPKCLDQQELSENEFIKECKSVFEHNGVHIDGFVDTLEGTFNLNRDWLESDIMTCIVEYCGVYPVNWDLDDVAKLVDMEDNGDIIVMVAWYDDDGNYICMNN